MKAPKSASEKAFFPKKKERTKISGENNIRVSGELTKTEKIIIIV